MRLTEEREKALRAIHTDNRYGVLELLEEIKILKEELALAHSNTSIKHKYRADCLEKERDEYREAAEKNGRIIDEERELQYKLVEERELFREALKEIASRVIKTTDSVPDVCWQFSLCVQRAQKALGE